MDPSLLPMQAFFILNKDMVPLYQKFMDPSTSTRLLLYLTQLQSQLYELNPKFTKPSFQLKPEIQVLDTLFLVKRTGQLLLVLALQLEPDMEMGRQAEVDGGGAIDWRSGCWFDNLSELATYFQLHHLDQLPFYQQLPRFISTLDKVFVDGYYFGLP